MRTKRPVSIAIICVLAITVLGAAMVYAPPPGDLTLPPLFNAFITNTEDDPVPVDLTDEAIDVNLDEPVEVTTPSGESLDVEVTNGVDVSGWLHTTRDATETRTIEYTVSYPMHFDTRGYRVVTVVIGVDVEAKVWVEWEIASDFFAFEEEFDIEIPDEDAEKITTVQQATDYINAHIN